jgi:hypothetical protein
MDSYHDDPVLVPTSVAEAVSATVHATVKLTENSRMLPESAAVRAEARTNASIHLSARASRPIVPVVHVEVVSRQPCTVIRDAPLCLDAPKQRCTCLQDLWRRPSCCTIPRPSTQLQATASAIEHANLDPAPLSASAPVSILRSPSGRVDHPLAMTGRHNDWS